MDDKEAESILTQHLSLYRAVPYPGLVQRIDTVEVTEVTAPSGAVYQLEFQFFWESSPNREIRVLGSIDDGGFRAFKPLCDDFIIAPDGSFVGE
jgi:hypothetical protein